MLTSFLSNRLQCVMIIPSIGLIDFILIATDCKHSRQEKNVIPGERVKNLLLYILIFIKFLLSLLNNNNVLIVNQKC